MPPEPGADAPPPIAAMHHVALSVADLERSARWYEELFGLTRLLEQQSPERRAIVFRFPGRRLSFGLVQHGEARAAAFDPTTVGLDTVAFSVGSRADLEAWVERFDRYGASHSGFLETPFGAMVNFVDPDGIQLALFWEREAG